MDLIGCPQCNERFLLRDAGAEGWSCPSCRAEMRVIVHRIPSGVLAAESLGSGRLQRATLRRDMPSGARPTGP
jgi:hypothetical protein